jgi:hypothetical protein
LGSFGCEANDLLENGRSSMMIKRVAVIVALGLVIGMVSGEAFADPTTIECIDYGQIGPAGDDEGKYAGMYEYIYDVQGGTEGWTRFVTLRGFDESLIQNMSMCPQAGEIRLVDVWDGHSVAGYPYWGGWQDKNISPSWWDGSDWVLSGNTDIAHYNYWHDGSDYGDAWNFARYGGYLITDGVQWDRYRVNYAVTYTIMTIRLIHPHAPGTIEGETYHNSDYAWVGDIVGPVPEPATMGLLSLGGIALLRRRK